MDGRMEVSFEVETAEHKAKCRVCNNNIYPGSLRGVVTGYENLYWADNYEGKVNEIKNFYVHLDCLIKMFAEKGMKLKKKQLQEEIGRLEKIKEVAEDK